MGSSPAARSPAADALLDGLVDGVDWSGQYFNGAQQIFGITVTGQFLTPGQTDVFQYPAGLTPADFGPVEMGLNFIRAEPGAVIFGSVQFLGADCPGDVDDSGGVDFDDLLRVLSAWGPCEDCPEDLNGDDFVDFDDLLLVLATWGPCE